MTINDQRTNQIDEWQRVSRTGRSENFMWRDSIGLILPQILEAENKSNDQRMSSRDEIPRPLLFFSPFDKDRLRQLGHRPDPTTRQDPPSILLDNNSSRVSFIRSIYSITLAERCFAPLHSQCQSLIEHLQIERDYSERSGWRVCRSVGRSDDLSLTVRILVSLAHHGCHSPEDLLLLLQRYLQLWRNGFIWWWEIYDWVMPMRCPKGLVKRRKIFSVGKKNVRRSILSIRM